MQRRASRMYHHKRMSFFKKLRKKRKKTSSFNEGLIEKYTSLTERKRRKMSKDVFRKEDLPEKDEIEIKK